MPGILSSGCPGVVGLSVCLSVGRSPLFLQQVPTCLLATRFTDVTQGKSDKNTLNRSTRVTYGVVPSSLDPSSHVLQAFLVISGMFPSKYSLYKLVSGHTCCISESPYTVWAPQMGKSSPWNWALGVRFGTGQGGWSGRLGGMLRGVYKSVFVTLQPR